MCACTYASICRVQLQCLKMNSNLPVSVTWTSFSLSVSSAVVIRLPQILPNLCGMKVMKCSKRAEQKEISCIDFQFRST